MLFAFYQAHCLSSIGWQNQTSLECVLLTFVMWSCQQVQCIVFVDVNGIWKLFYSWIFKFKGYIKLFERMCFVSFYPWPHGNNAFVKISYRSFHIFSMNARMPLPLMAGVMLMHKILPYYDRKPTMPTRQCSPIFSMYIMTYQEIYVNGECLI